MDDLFGGLIAGLLAVVWDTLDRRNRGLLIWWALVATTVVCAVIVLANLRTAWPAVLVVGVFLGGYCLIGWRLNAVAPVNPPPDQAEVEDVAMPADELP